MARFGCTPRSARRDGRRRTSLHGAFSWRRASPRPGQPRRLSRHEQEEPSGSVARGRSSPRV